MHVCVRRRRRIYLPNAGRISLGGECHSVKKGGLVGIPDQPQHVGGVSGFFRGAYGAR